MEIQCRRDEGKACDGHVSPPITRALHGICTRLRMPSYPLTPVQQQYVQQVVLRYRHAVTRYLYVYQHSDPWKLFFLSPESYFNYASLTNKSFR